MERISIRSSEEAQVIRVTVLLGRIMATPKPWVTSQDPPDSLPATHNQTVFLYGLNKVVATRWFKAAHGADERTEQPLIHANQRDGCPPRQSKNQTDEVQQSPFDLRCLRRIFCASSRTDF